MTKTQIFLQNFCHGQICCPKTLESRKKPAENKQTAKAVCYLSRYSYSTVYLQASKLGRLLVRCLFLFRRNTIVVPAVRHVVVIFFGNLCCTEILAVFQIVHPVLFLQAEQAAKLHMALKLLFVSDHAFCSIWVKGIENHAVLLEVLLFHFHRHKNTCRKKLTVLYLWLNRNYIHVFKEKQA